MLEPTMPPPSITTSAVCMLLALQGLPLMGEGLILRQRFFGSLHCLCCRSSVGTVHGDNELRQIPDDLSESWLLRSALRLSFTSTPSRTSKFFFIFCADLASLSCCVDIFNRLVRLPQGLHQFQLQRKLLFQILRRGLYARIHSELEWLGVGLAIHH